MTAHQSSNIAPARTRSTPNTAMRHAYSAASDPRLRAHAEWPAFTTDGVSAVCSDWHVAPITRKPQRH